MAQYMTLRNKIDRELSRLVVTDKEGKADVISNIKKAQKVLTDTTQKDAIASAVLTTALNSYSKDVRRLSPTLPISRYANQLATEIADNVSVDIMVEAAVKNPQPELYVVNSADALASDGGGEGSWVKPSKDPRDLKKQLESAVGGDGQNWSIQDVRNFPDLGRTPNTKDVAIMVEALEFYELIAVLAAYEITKDASDAVDLLERGYAVLAGPEEYARAYVDQAGGVADLDEGTRLAYLDQNKVVEEASRGVEIVELSSGPVYTFEV